MKTSKRLLSFFLAVVMLVSACSVGIQAFAASVNPPITEWTKPTSDEVTLERLNAAFDYYFDDIVNIKEVKTLLESIGVTVDKNTTVKSIATDLYPMLYDLYFKTLGNKVAGVKWPSTIAVSGVVADNFKDGENPNFADMYVLAKEYENSNDKVVKAYAEKLLNGNGSVKGLQAIFDLAGQYEKENALDWSTSWDKIYSFIINNGFNGYDGLPTFPTTKEPFIKSRDTNAAGRTNMSVYSSKLDKYVNNSDPTGSPEKTEFVSLYNSYVKAWYTEYATPTKAFAYKGTDYAGLKLAIGAWKADDMSSKYGDLLNYKYSYADYKPTNEEQFLLANAVANSFLGLVLDPNKELVIGGLSLPIGSVIDEVINGKDGKPGLLTTKIDLNAITTDLIKDLATNPIGTVVDLVPVLAILIDEVVVGGMFMTEEEEAKREGTLNSMNGILGVVATFVPQLSGLDLVMDLNVVLPELMQKLQYMLIMADAVKGATDAEKAAIDQAFIATANVQNAIVKNNDDKFTGNYSQDYLAMLINKLSIDATKISSGSTTDANNIVTYQYYADTAMLLASSSNNDAIYTKLAENYQYNMVAINANSDLIMSTVYTNEQLAAFANYFKINFGGAFVTIPGHESEVTDLASFLANTTATNEEKMKLLTDCYMFKSGDDKNERANEVPVVLAQLYTDEYINKVETAFGLSKSAATNGDYVKNIARMNAIFQNNSYKEKNDAAINAIMDAAVLDKYTSSATNNYIEYAKFVCAQRGVDADTYSSPIVDLVKKLVKTATEVAQTTDLNDVPNGLFKVINALGQVIVPSWKGFSNLDIDGLKADYAKGKTADTLNHTVTMLLGIVNPVLSLLNEATSNKESITNISSILQSFMPQIQEAVGGNTIVDTLLALLNSDLNGFVQTIMNVFNDIGGLGKDSIINFAVNEVLNLQDDESGFKFTLPTISTKTVMYILANIAPIVSFFFNGEDAPKGSVAIGDLIDGVIAGLVHNINWPDGSSTALWNFLNYVQTGSYGFTYPTGITELDANNAVNQIDTLIPSVFSLLSQFGVVKDVTGLNDLINDNLYTNQMVSTIFKGIYGGIEGAVEGGYVVGNLTLPDLLKIANIDITTDGVAKLLTDSSYGQTYPSIARAISGHAWKDVTANFNWGVYDSKTFANAIAAILRPLNKVFTILLAGDSIKAAEMQDAIKYTMLPIIKGLVGALAGTDSLIGEAMNDVDLETAFKELEKHDAAIYGGNGYESAVVPVLEALLCDGFVSYDQYKANIAKSKDSVLTDILNPLLNKVTQIADDPINTLTQMAPNIGYFMANGGLTQTVTNALTPITSLISDFIVRNNAVDMDKVVNIDTINSLIGSLLSSITGMDFSSFNILDLKTLKIESLIIPLVNTILPAVNVNIQIPEINWSTLASHGTVTQQPSAVNSTGVRTIVVARQGETLIAVLRYVLDVLDVAYNAGLSTTLNDLIAGLGTDATGKKLVPMLQAAIQNLIGMSSDDVIITLFYFLKGGSTNSYWDYSNYISKSYKFRFPKGINARNSAAATGVLDELLGGVANLPKLVGDALYTNDLVNTAVKGIYGAISGIKISDTVSITQILDILKINITPAGVAATLRDGSYGATFNGPASVIASATNWDKVDFSKIDWGVKDQATFLQALVAALRPFFGVLDVLLNGGSLGVLDSLNIPGSNGYESSIIPLLEAFQAKGVVSYAQYQADVAKAKDNLLLDILNPLFGVVNELLKAPISVLADRIPNIAYFIANDGIIQLVNQLVTPVTAIVKVIEPIASVNEILAALDVNINGQKIDVNNIGALLTPYVGKDNIVPLINKLLGSLEIGGAKLSLVLNPIDWSKLASHSVVKSAASAGATIGQRKLANSKDGETLIAVLRYLIDTVKSGKNLDTITNLVGGLLGGADSSISDMIGSVLAMLTSMDTDELIITLFQLFGLWEEVPETGDASLAAFAVLSVVSAGALVALGVTAKRKKEQE